MVTISTFKENERQKKQSFTDNRNIFWNHTSFHYYFSLEKHKRLKWEWTHFKLKVQPFVCKSLLGCGLLSFEASDFSMKQLQLKVPVKRRRKSNSSSLLHFSLLRWVCISFMFFPFQAKPNYRVSNSSVKQKLCALASSY